jgi:hypothetical protein
MALSRIIALIAVLLLLIVISRGNIVQHSDAPAPSHTANDLISQLSQFCYVSWQQYEWTIGEQATLARDNAAFSGGIQRICQARAELFFEGYEVSPFIAPDSQHRIFPIVFIPNVDAIKSVLRQNLPPLNMI